MSFATPFDGPNPPASRQQPVGEINIPCEVPFGYVDDRVCDTAAARQGECEVFEVLFSVDSEELAVIQGETVFYDLDMTLGMRRATFLTDRRPRCFTSFNGVSFRKEASELATMLRFKPFGIVAAQQTYGGKDILNELGFSTQVRGAANTFNNSGYEIIPGTPVCAKPPSIHPAGRAEERRNTPNRHGIPAQKLLGVNYPYDPLAARDILFHCLREFLMHSDYDSFDLNLIAPNAPDAPHRLQVETEVGLLTSKYLSSLFFKFLLLGDELGLVNFNEKLLGVIDDKGDIVSRWSTDDTFYDKLCNFFEEAMIKFAQGRVDDSNDTPNIEEIKPKDFVKEKMRRRSIAGVLGNLLGLFQTGPNTRPENAKKYSYGLIEKIMGSYLAGNFKTSAQNKLFSIKTLLLMGNEIRPSNNKRKRNPIGIISEPDEDVVRKWHFIETEAVDDFVNCNIQLMALLQSQIIGICANFSPPMSNLDVVL